MKGILTLAFIAILGLGAQAKGEIVKSEFYANGNLKAEYVDQGNDLIAATYYYADGTINETGFFKDDKLTGEWKTYNVQAELIASGSYTKSKKTGNWKVYKDGVQIHEMDYSPTQIARK